MRKQKGSSGEYAAIAVAAVALLVIFCAAWAISAAQCGSKWEGSGLKSDYGLIAGCRVKLPDGRWLPEERVREIEIDPKGGAK